MRILHITSTLDGGGIPTFIKSYYEHICDKIIFDFAISDYNVGIYEEYFLNHNSKIFRVPRISNDPIRYYRSIREILNNNKYDAVHVHAGGKSFISLLAAKKIGIPVRIAHSHIAYIPESKKELVIRYISTLFTKKCATKLVACSKDAGVWMWGEKNFKRGNVSILKNAIEVDRYIFDKEIRERIRLLNHWDESFVVMCVARLSEQKNHAMLLEIFKKIVNLKKNAILVLIGNGELEEKIRGLVNDFEMNNSVLFLGARDDVHLLYNAADVFVLPTLYEGLGIVFLEAQINGLPCITSKKVVPGDVVLTELIKQVDLTSETDQWAEEAIKISNKRALVTSSRYAQEVRDAGFDINIESKHLLDFYYELQERNPNV